MTNIDSATQSTLFSYQCSNMCENTCGNKIRTDKDDKLTPWIIQWLGHDNYTKTWKG